MGLIKAFAGSAASYMSDLWEDYIYCDALDENTLVQHGRKKRSPGAGGRANENLITEGSRIAVNVGQTLIVVENGQILDVSAEPGGYVFKSGTEPSVFCGEFGGAMKMSFEAIRARFAFGGIAGNDQRAYFINTKEILNNRFGFGQVPYRDSEFNMTVLLKGFGIYSYIISDPLVFFTNISGNVKDSYSKGTLEAALRGELQNAMLPVLGELADAGIRYDKLPGKTELLVDHLNARLSDSWEKTRGIQIKTISFSNVLPDAESIEKIRQLQESRVYSDNKSMLGARVGAASASAMESAAENTSGAVNGFMGMGMAQSAGGVNVNELMKEAPAPKADSNTWTCSCGMTNTLNFCPNCGSKRPEILKCKGCGFEIPPEFAAMKFCPNCGRPRD